MALILAATPTAIATYVMAQELKGDLHLARSLVMLTTLLSIFSFTLYLFYCKNIFLGEKYEELQEFQQKEKSC